MIPVGQRRLERGNAEHPMRFLFTTLGTSGDVDPHIGIGQKLLARGHEVIFLTHPYFEKLVQRSGFEFRPVGTEADYQEFLDDPDLWRGRRAFAVLVKLMLKTLGPLYQAVAEEYKPGETAIAAGTMALGARLLHEKHGAPLASVHLQPFAFGTDAIAPPLSPDEPLPGEDKMLPIFNGIRAKLGLDSVRSVFHGWYHSPHEVLGLFPEWFAPDHHWPPHTDLLGFPFYDEKGLVEVPPEVNEFLEEGEPPVVVTFGTGMKQAEEYFKGAVEGLKKLGRRALLLTKYPEQLPDPLPEGMKTFSFVPFSEVLPRTAAIMYHGGIGTLSQAFRAGIPQVIIPFAHDQPDNAVQIKKVGVGDYIKPKEFTAERVTEVFARVLDDQMIQDRCRELQSRTSSGDCLTSAADKLESLIGTDEKEGCPV